MGNQLKNITIILVLGVFAAAPVVAAIVTSHLASDAEMLGAAENFAFVAEGRIGDLGGAATFELDLGDDTGNPYTVEQYAWQSGVEEPFVLTYVKATNVVSYTLGGKTLTYSPGLSFQEIFVRARAVNDGTSVEVYDLILNGEAVGDASSAFGPDGLDILAISGVELYDGFTLTGTARLTWTGSPPTQSRLAFQIKVGSAPTVPVEDSSWGKVKSLYAD